MVTSIPNRMYVGTNKQYYVQGEQVVIDGRTAIFLPEGSMDFVIKDNYGNQIYSIHFNQPYNHGGYQDFSPPNSIFKSTPPYYTVTGSCGGFSDTKPFSYY